MAHGRASSPASRRELSVREPVCRVCGPVWHLSRVESPLASDTTAGNVQRGACRRSIHQTKMLNGDDVTSLRELFRGEAFTKCAKCIVIALPPRPS